MADAGTVPARNSQGETSLFIMGRSVRFRSSAPSNFWGSLLKLVGHLAGTALIFVVFILLVWVVSYAVSGLDGFHKFPQNVLDIITHVEIWLIYVDVALCSVVLILGTIRFGMEIWENRHE